MGRSLSSYTIGRDNNFNLIRLLAAFFVLFSHSFTLVGVAGSEPLYNKVGMTFGEVAVDIFFVTSGFLITNSYISKNNLKKFILARLLRIYPALIVAVIFSVFVVGLYFTNISAVEYFFNRQTQEYLFKNILIVFGVDFNLPGVFLNVPYKGVVNGSLWTLPYEVRMYAILAFVLGAAAYIGKIFKFVTIGRILLLIGIFSISLHMFNPFQATLPAHATRLFYMFFAGATFFAWRDKILLSSSAVYICSVLLIFSSFSEYIFDDVYCFLLPYFVIYAAYVPSGMMRSFNNCGDYSYGMYIYSFTIQQIIAQVMSGISVLPMIIASFFITLPISMLSWHLIEQRFLRIKVGLLT